jgi:hypothetical protein
LEFGYSAIGSENSLSFTIDNTGGLPLEVTLVLSNSDQFSVIDSSLITVLSQERRVVTVVFIPTVVATFMETLTIFSNDAVNSAIIVQMTGTSEITSSQPDTIIVLTDNPRVITTVNGGGPTTAISAFEIRDSLNQPIGLSHQHEVYFILSGPPANGGAFVSPQAALTNDSGTVFTTVNSGITPGLLELIARIIRNSDGRIIESEPDTIYVQ